MAFLISCGSIFQVIGFTSTITGLAPTNKIGFIVAIKVREGTITSSPSPIPNW